MPLIIFIMPERRLHMSFSMYVCLFMDVHVCLPIDKFTLGVHWILNVAPT